MVEVADMICLPAITPARWPASGGMHYDNRVA